MRVGGPLVFDLLLLGTGQAVLYGIGVVRSRGQALVYAGLALVVGWCALGAAIVYALILGASLEVWQPILLTAALAAGALALGRVIRAGDDTLEGRERGPAQVCAVAAAALVVGYLALLGLHAALTTSPTGWDTWAFWLPRAKAIFSFHGLHPHLQGGFDSFAHPEYPPLVPAIDATVFRFAGDASVLTLPFQDWLLATAFVAAAAAVLRRRVRPAVLWPALCLLVLAPQFGASIGEGYADPELARLIALAAVCGGVWVLERDGRLLAVTGILLVGASLTKREGLGLGLLLAVTLALAARVEGGRGWARALLLVPVLIFAALPWQIWLHVERVAYKPDYSLRTLFHPGYLSGRLGRLGIALERLPRIALSFDHWLLVLPLALLLAFLVIGTRSSLAVLVLGAIGAGYLGLACVYWIGTLPVDWYMRTSASRVVASLVVLAGALTPLVAAELLRGERVSSARLE
ncbi:MAG TPA: hypothetical protein VIR59_00555 [Gaiellaceae bacterium]